MADRTPVWRYYAFRATNSAGVYLPVAIVFLQDRFDLAFVGLAYAVFSFGMVTAEITTGYRRLARPASRRRPAGSRRRWRRSCSSRRRKYGERRPGVTPGDSYRSRPNRYRT